MKIINSIEDLSVLLYQDVLILDEDEAEYTYAVIESFIDGHYDNNKFLYDHYNIKTDMLYELFLYLTESLKKSIPVLKDVEINNSYIVYSIITFITAFLLSKGKYNLEEFKKDIVASFNEYFFYKIKEQININYDTLSKILKNALEDNITFVNITYEKFLLANSYLYKLLEDSEKEIEDVFVELTGYGIKSNVIEEIKVLLVIVPKT